MQLHNFENTVDSYIKATLCRIRTSLLWHSWVVVLKKGTVGDTNLFRDTEVNVVKDIESTNFSFSSNKNVCPHRNLADAIITTNCPQSGFKNNSWIYIVVLMVICGCFKTGVKNWGMLHPLTLCMMITCKYSFCCHERLQP